MPTLRRAHLYLGCFFSPLLIYFSISGAWQLYRWNNLPRNAPATASQRAFHALSDPHTESTFPGLDRKKDKSALFSAFSLLMAAGIVVTSLLGILMALKLPGRRKFAVLWIAAGVAVPIVLLLLR